MLSEELRLNTQSSHQILEKKLLGHLKAIRTATDYARLISAFYSYFGGLELLILNAIDKDILPDYDARRKSIRLKEDLQHLKAGIPDLAGKESLPEIQNTDQALGALYVIEGSTLGGQIICKMLAPLQLGSDSGLSFFSGYGAATSAMWERFKTSIDSARLNEKEVLKAANDTFVLLNRWFEERF